MFENATAAKHARAWPGTVRRVVAAVRDAGALTDRRRLLAAGLLWQATVKLAHRGSFAEARVLWRQIADEDGLIDARRRFEGLAYLRTHKLAAYNRFKERYVTNNWPDLMTLPGSATYGRAELPNNLTPAVAVVMSVYNGQRYLRAAAGSILKQTFRDFEFVVVDDGSTDATPEILADLARRDCRVRVIGRPNKGLIASLNEAVAASTAPLVARMDADDVALPERLRLQVERMAAEPDLVLLGGQTLDIDPCGLPLTPYPLPTGHAEIDAELMAGKGGADPPPGRGLPPGRLRSRRRLRPGGGPQRGSGPLATPGRGRGGWRTSPRPCCTTAQHPASINRTKADVQRRSNEQSVRRAHERRGLPVPPYRHDAGHELDPVPVVLARWGWSALSAGEVTAARAHARALLRRAPASPAAWKLMRCALRGH